MSETSDLVAAVRASFRLVLGDASALAALDCSFGGFWKSFRVMGLLAPTVLVSTFAARVLAVAHGDDPAVAEAANGLGTAFLSYALGWIAFPILIAAVARPFGLSQVYVPWMVARNWTSIPAALPAFVVAVTWLAGLIPNSALGPASLAGLGLSLYCSIVVARLVAGLPVVQAVGFVLLDLFLSLLIETGVDRLFG